jgi:hypothetical protein
MKLPLLLLTISFGGAMAFAGDLADRADQIFRIGPETLVAQSSKIVAGQIVAYSREVHRNSGPGPNAMPMEWTAQGHIDHPVVLKGASPPAPIYFSKLERSSLLPSSPIAPSWEMALGELMPGGQAILFFVDRVNPKVLPAGTGEGDLLVLVKDIVRIQDIRGRDEQIRGWLQYLATAPTSEGQRAALRSLVSLGANWSQVEPALAQLAAGKSVTPDLRAYVFGFVSYHLTAETWGVSPNGPLEFLCRMFSTEKGPEQQLRYLQRIKLLLLYTVAEPLEESRRPVRESLIRCLETWASRGLTDPELKQEYDQLRQKYR